MDLRDPVNVSAPTGQQYLVRRRPHGSMETVENPNYRQSFQSYGDPVSNCNAAVAQARPIGEAKIAEYQRRADAEPEKAGQFKAELTQWWTQNMASPLAGLPSAAEQANATLQAQNDAAQRTEDQRAETINRARQQLGCRRQGTGGMTDQAMRDEDQRREDAVAAFRWVANTLVDSIPQLIEDNMAYLSQLLPDPATGMTYQSHVWGAVWAPIGDEWFTYLLRHDHATLYTLLRAMWRRQLAWEEHAGS